MSALQMSTKNLTVAVLLTARDQLSGALAGAAKTLDNFGAKAEAIGRKMEGFGTRVGAIGVAGQAGLSRLGLDLGTLASKAIESERALYGIAATAGVAGSKARAMVTEWTVAVNQIAIATNQSQERVTAAFNDMIAKGLDPKVALQMLKPIGQAATAAGADIQDMASAAQAGFSKLKIDAADAGKALDIMAQAGKSGAFELRDMAGFFDKLTASAANLGIAGQEGLASVAAAAQIARRGTGDAASAATNLDNFLGKLNAAVTYKAFAEMGVDLGKLKEEAKASGDYIGYMAQAINGLTGGDTAKIADLFTDIQAGAFIQGMVRDLDDYKAIRDEALNASGVAAQDFATAMQSAGAQVDQFKIGATAAVNSGSALKEILSVLTGIANWANENPELAKWLIFGTAALAVGGATVAAIGAIVTAIGTLVPALTVVTAFLAANPVVLAILGLAAVGTAVYVYWDEILAAMKSFWDSTKTLFKAGVQFLTDAFLNWTPLGLFIKHFDSIKKAAVGWVADFKLIGINIIQGIIDGVTAKAKALYDKIKGIGGSIKSTIMDVLDMHSPSREMMLIGENTVLGMLIGMENESENLIDTAEKIAEDTVKAFQKPFRDNKGRFLPADEADRAATEWARASDDIEKSLTDALMRGFEGGKGWADNFVDTLKNMFSSLVLKPILQPIAQYGSNMVMGMLGMGGSGSALAGDGTGIMGLLGNGGSLYNMASGIGQNALSYGAFGTSAANVVGSNLVISGSAQEAALAAQWAGGGYSVAPAAAGSMAAYGGALGGALYGYEKGGVRGGVIGGVAGYAGGAALAGGMAAAGGGVAAAGAGAMAGASAALAAIPVWGWIALAALAIFGGGKVKPSDKSAWGSVDLETGAAFDVGSMTGKKQASDETLGARDYLVDAVAAWPVMIEQLGGKLTGTVEAIIGERDGLRFGVNGGAWENYGADPSAAVARLYRELALGAEGLEEPYRTLLGYFEGSAEELMSLAGTLVLLQDYMAADPMGALADAAAEAAAAGRTAWEVWQRQGVDLRTALTAWDGSATATAELANLTQSRYQVELALAQQIYNALASTSAMFATTAEEMRYSTLDQAGKYDFLRDKSAELEEALKAAYDPAEIESLARQLNETSKSAWQLLGEEERRIKIGEYEKYLAEIDAITTERLNVAGATLTAEHDGSLPDSITAAIETAMSRVADAFMAAAAAQQAAADTPVTVNVNVEVDTPADVEVAYGG